MTRVEKVHLVCEEYRLERHLRRRRQAPFSGALVVHEA